MIMDFYKILKQQTMMTILANFWNCTRNIKMHKEKDKWKRKYLHFLFKIQQEYKKLQEIMRIIDMMIDKIAEMAITMMKEIE